MGFQAGKGIRPRPPTKKPCVARKDLDFLMNFLGFSDEFRVFLPGSGRLWGDSGKVRRGLGDRGEGLGKVLSFVTLLRGSLQVPSAHY